jgi:integral membrane protein
MWKTPIGRLRAAGFLEGTSFLILLFIAMPLKYAADIPEPVTVIGMLHGALFILYLLTIANALVIRDLTFVKSLLAFAAAFVPFGPFLLNRKLHK